MSVIRPDFHESLASQILNDIFYQRSSYFYFLGKINPWNSGEQAPTTLLNSVEQDISIRDNLLYMRKIAPTEVSLVTASYDWESGTVFAQWDHTLEMQGQNFYCLTDEFNVYKCLDNNNGATSTVKPTGNTVFPFRTADGYLWKYMYNVPVFKRAKFNSRGYLPVQKALSDSFYNNGAIEDVVVNASGSGYTDALLTSFTVTGTTTGSGATASIATVGSLGQIATLTLGGGGSNYTAGAAVTITSSTGTGAVITPTISGGVITGFTIVNSGFGYTTSDTVSISVGGAVLIPVVSQSTGSIVDVRIDNPGAGYTANPTVSIVQTPATGSGLYGHATAVIKPIVYQGSIVRVMIEDPGQDYPADNATTIVVSGDGEGASFSPVVSNGRVVDVVVESAGTGYSYINLDVVGAGSGADVSGIVASSDFLSDQSYVEQTAVDGAIYSVVVTEPGDNYTNGTTTVTFTGDGVGAEGYPVIVNGTITQIIMTSFGSNYTYANVTIADTSRQEPNEFTDAQAYAVLPPANGHGFNAVSELYGDTLSIFTLLRGDTQLNLLEQDYRQYGLIKNPTYLDSGERVTDSTAFVTFDIELATVGTLAPDDILINNSKRYRIVSIAGTTVRLQQLSSVYSTPSGSFYKDGTPNILYNILDVVASPTANKYSGSLLYTTNSTPFTPTDQQSVAIRTYIKL